MNLPELQTFLTILRCGSLVGAAQALNVTQSTVTARLKSLEEELGQTLIHRQKSGATLTPAGMRLKRYAETIADLWRQARQETALPPGIETVCNMACHPDLWEGPGREIFRAIQRDQKQVGLTVWQGSEAEITGWRQAGLVNLTISYSPATGQDFVNLPLISEMLILVSSNPDAPLKYDPGYVFVEAGEAFGREHAAAYADADTARLAFGNALAGLEHLRDIGGSAYLPTRLVRSDLAAGHLHEIAGAKSFQRQSFVSVGRAERVSWDWLEKLIEDAAKS